MLRNEVDLKKVWNQRVIPVALRRDGPGERVRLRLPKRPGLAIDEITYYEFWLRNGSTRRPFWNSPEKYWEIPRRWFNEFINRALNEFGKVYIIQPWREQEVCSRSCMEATGHECNCSCMGENHGAGMGGGWFEVSDAFATRWHDRELACRLLEKKSLSKSTAL